MLNLIALYLQRFLNRFVFGPGMVVLEPIGVSRRPVFPDKVSARIAALTLLDRGGVSEVRMRCNVTGQELGVVRGLTPEEEADREEFWAEFNRGWGELTDEQLEDERRERALWDNTLLDGLEDEEDVCV